MASGKRNNFFYESMTRNLVNVWFLITTILIFKKGKTGCNHYHERYKVKVM